MGKLRYISNYLIKACCTRFNQIIFTFFFISGYTGFGQPGSAIDEIIAVVGGNIIIRSDIENQYYQMKQQGIDTKGDIKCEILEQLIFQKLLVNQAELDSIEITLKEVEDMIDRKLKMIIAEIGDVSKLEESFGKTIQEIKEALKEPMKEQLLAEKMQNKLTGEVKITPDEVRKFFKNIPKDSLPLINAEYEFEQIAKYPAVSEQEKLAVLEELRGFRDRIQNGEKFCMFASFYSEDQGTAADCGELGFVGRGDIVPEFAAVAFNLKPGEISKVVETEYGYHLIKKKKKKGELINVRHILRKPKISEQQMIKARFFLDSVRKLILNDTLKFTQAAELFSGDETSRNNGGLAVNPYTGTSKFEADQLDGPTYYALKNLKQGELSTPFETLDIKGKKVFKIVKLKSYSEAHKANLKDDYQYIQELALANKKQDIFIEWVNKKQKSTYIRLDPSYKNCRFINLKL
ncbi:MAG: peptidylprolyl isomerase [Bacteroidia bacterium]|nr:peptidylprolyl isomerase [Bacteroidia bacterium]